MEEPMLILDGIAKCYRRGAAHRTLKGALERLVRGRRSYAPHETPRELWALRDVSFSLRRGEVLGIIGRNGAGKTTLLRIISRITAPTRGSVTIRGTVGSYLGMGVGMHQELTGRENVHMSGSLLGMSRRDVQRAMEGIIAFSELADAMDMPVKFFSSGMRARLAFSIAAHLDQKDILIIDEALAAGDIAFCQKCLQKISELVSGGQTALFASHSLGQIRGLSTHCLYLKDGGVAAYGETNSVVAQYVADVEKEASSR